MFVLVLAYFELESEFDGLVTLATLLLAIFALVVARLIPVKDTNYLSFAYDFYEERPFAQIFTLGVLIVVILLIGLRHLASSEVAFVEGLDGTATRISALSELVADGRSQLENDQLELTAVLANLSAQQAILETNGTDLAVTQEGLIVTQTEQAIEDLTASVQMQGVSLTATENRNRDVSLVVRELTYTADLGTLTESLLGLETQQARLDASQTANAPEAMTLAVVRNTLEAEQTESVTAQAMLETQRMELSTEQVTATAQQSEFETAQASLEAEIAEVSGQRNELATEIIELGTQETQLGEQSATLQSQQVTLDAQQTQLATDQMALAVTQAQMEPALADLQASREALRVTETAVATAQTLVAFVLTPPTTTPTPSFTPTPTPTSTPTPSPTLTTVPTLPPDFEGTVLVDNAFRMDSTEVTVAEYRENFIDMGGYQQESQDSWSPQGWAWWTVERDRRGIENGPIEPFSVEDEEPRIFVTFYEAEAYCVKVGGRLPTQAEWQAAVNWATENDRLGESGPTDERVAIANLPEGLLHYINNNVREWVADPVDANAERLTVGGSFLDEALEQRELPETNVGATDIGFRCVYDIP